MFPRSFFRSLLATMIAGSVLAVGLAQAQERLVPGDMKARTAACAQCHGSQGQGTDNDYFPRLAGKPAGYLFNQLKNFREGHRRYPQMNYLMTYMSDPYLQQIAKYYSDLHPPYPAPTPPAVSAQASQLGKQLVTQGDPSRKIPACMACHGPGLTGTQPDIPGLVGLHADYISAQLGAWKSGVRKSFPPTCMEQIAPRLNDADVTAVAAWLASQQAPQNALPRPASAASLPANCGM